MASGNTITNSNSSTTTWTSSSSTSIYTTANPYLYNSIKVNQSPFSLSFSWEDKTVNITLKDGNDIFKLANIFMKLLDDNGIEYKVKTSGKRKKK